MVRVTVRRVTVRQLFKATQLHTSAPFQIDGKDIKLVVLLGNPYEVSTGSELISFTLDDGTGRIRVQLWKEWGQRMVQILESPYVRVVGELQTYHGTKIVRANNIFAAPNPYEIFEHILKAIQETIICAQDERYALEDDPEQMPDTDIGNPQDASYVSPTNGWSTQFGDDLDICAPIRSMRLDNSGLSAAVIQGAEETLSPLPSSNLANSSTTLHLQDPYLDLSALERDIMQALKHLTLQTEPSLQGFAIHDIFDLVCERTPDVAEATFQNALNFLINEGYIYRPLVNSHCMLNE